MRLAVFVTVFPTLSETFVLDQIAALRERGHRVSVFARPPEGPPFLEDIPERSRPSEGIFYVEQGPRATLRLAGETLRALWTQREGPLPGLGQETRSGKPLADRLLISKYAHATRLAGSRFDAVVAHFGSNGVLAQALRDQGALQGPLATLFHGRDISLVLRQRGLGYYRPLFEKAELMLPVSEYFRRRLIDLGCPESKVRVHRMGVDTKLLAYQPRRLLAGESVRLLSVCRLVEKKGVDFAMRALARLLGSGVEFAWSIVGDGPELRNLKRLSHALGLRRHVTFLGPQRRERVRSLLQEAHIFLGTSVTSPNGDEEGVPVALMEAMASGLPVVSTFHSGIPELVRDGKTGVLVQENDVAQLAARLAGLFASPAEWPELGLAGRSVVESEYDQGKLHAELDRCLQELATATNP